VTIVYMPSTECPACPFNTLCREERKCPILQKESVETPNIKEELRRFSEINTPYASHKIQNESVIRRPSQV